MVDVENFVDNNEASSSPFSSPRLGGKVPMVGDTHTAYGFLAMKEKNDRLLRTSWPHSTRYPVDNNHPIG